jgi:hypothetical protein
MYAKLFSSITESSLWSEPKEVRLLFVTMLAKADQVGFVEASVIGLARVANLTVEETQAALEVLRSPDPYSKNPANEGRRILDVQGGFILLNYEDYRERRNAEERREYMREYMREYRGRKQPVNSGKLPLAGSKPGKPRLAQAETEAEADADAKKVVEQASPKPPRKVAVSCPTGIDPQLWSDWAAVRTAKRAGVITVTVMRSMQQEADKAGIPLVQAIEIAAARGWQAFKADWAWRDTPKQAEYKTL